MRIKEHIFFAPDILLKDLNLRDKDSLINAFKDRVRNYYLRPIDTLNKMKCAYSVAIMEFSMIDTIARYSTISDRIGSRIKEMIMNNFNTTYDIAERAYNDFRNGLLHENHIKNNGQLCYETHKAFLLENNCLIINPLKLQIELDQLFNRFIKELKEDNSSYHIFLDRIQQNFEGDIEYFKECSC